MQISIYRQETLLKDLSFFATETENFRNVSIFMIQENKKYLRSDEVFWFSEFQSKIKLFITTHSRGHLYDSDTNSSHAANFFDVTVN